MTGPVDAPLEYGVPSSLPQKTYLMPLKQSIAVAPRHTCGGGGRIPAQEETSCSDREDDWTPPRRTSTGFTLDLEVEVPRLES